MALPDALNEGPALLLVGAFQGHEDEAAHDGVGHHEARESHVRHEEDQEALGGLFGVTSHSFPLFLGQAESATPSVFAPCFRLRFPGQRLAGWERWGRRKGKGRGEVRTRCW